jgi:predicted TPR repeat methyltransferase
MNTESTLGQALNHLRGGNPAEAEKLCRQVLAERPDDPVALRYLGIIAFQGGDLATAEGHLRHAVAAHPGDAKGHNNLGSVLQSGGRSEEAESAFLRALECDPSLVDAHFNLGVLHHTAGRLDAAGSRYRQALDLDPGMAEARQNLERIDGRPDAENEAADLYRQGRREEALAACQHLLEAKPDDVDTLNFAAVIALELGDGEQSIAFLTTAIDRRPEFFEAQVNLGNALRTLGKPEDSVAAYERALEIDPDRAAAHVNLGNALHELSRLEQAADAYRRAIALEPNLAAAHNDLGTVLHELGDVDGAIGAYRRTIEVAGGHVDAAYNLARLLQNEGRLDEAVTAYGDVLALDPAHPNAAHMLAALTGETTETAPRGYVRDLFDFYAEEFDEHLTEKAGYRVPRLMREIVDRLGPGQSGGDDFPFERGLDLGCGTGLVGENFSELVGEFVAVDLAPKMVAQATLRGVYDDIHECELLEFFERHADPEAPFNLVLGADLFIYVGKLDNLFAAVSAHMAPSGLFIFSVETLAEGTYALLQSGRYAQSDAYIENLAETNGFRIDARDSIVVRHGPIDGAIFVLVKT